MWYFRSIESRVPFLSIEMAEFVLSLPESYLLSDNGQTKYIFREAMRGIVPDEILDRKDKIGFSTPEYQWIVNNRKELIESINTSNNINFINKEKVIGEIELVVSGKKSINTRTWALINYFKWNSLS